MQIDISPSDKEKIQRLMDQLSPESKDYFSKLNEAIELLKKYHKLYENSGSKDPDLIMLANKVLEVIVKVTDSLRRLFDHYFTMAYKVINEYEEDPEKSREELELSSKYLNQSKEIRKKLEDLIGLFVENFSSIFYFSDCWRELKTKYKDACDYLMEQHNNYLIELAENIKKYFEKLD